MKSGIIDYELVGDGMPVLVIHFAHASSGLEEVEN